jgi:hypothetical protein
MLFATDDGMLLRPETLEMPAPALIADLKNFAPIHEKLQEYLAKMIETVTGRTAFPVVARNHVTFPLQNVDEEGLREILAGASQVHLLVNRLCSVRMVPEWHSPLVIHARAHAEEHRQHYNARILGVLRFRAGLQTVHAFTDHHGGIVVPVDETDATNIATLYESIHAIGRDYGRGGTRLRMSQFLRPVTGRTAEPVPRSAAVVETPNLLSVHTPQDED